jgi:hypothetical protein
MSQGSRQMGGPVLKPARQGDKAELSWPDGPLPSLLLPPTEDTAGTQLGDILEAHFTFDKGRP